MQQRTVLWLGSICLIGCIVSAIQTAAARTAFTTFNNSTKSTLTEFQLQPRLSIEGYTGRMTLGQTQFLFPLVGSNNQALFTVLEGYLFRGSSAWNVGAGLGYRHTTQNNRIWGGYFVVDYNNSEGNHGFLVANPGLESLGQLWDFHANGYIPMTSKTWTEKAGWESDIGNYRFVDPKGHAFWDHRYRIYGETGRGFDVEIGRAFPKLNGLKFYLAGYRFDLKHTDSITGGQGRIEYPMNKYLTLEGIDTYDNNKHNTILLGLKIQLGGFNKVEKAKFGIATRLLDPLEHNLAVYGNNSIGTPIAPSVPEDEGQDEKKYDHVWYFRPDLAANTDEDGSAEHPYTGINQDILNHIQGDPNGGDYAELFFAPGGYGLTGFATDRMALPSQYDMWGRTENYKEPAEGEDRADFNGGLDFYSGGQNSVKAIQLDNNVVSNGNNGLKGEQNIGININGGALDINNTRIGKLSVNQGYLVGIDAEGATLNLNNSEINCYTESEASNAIYTLAGIYANSSTVNLNDNNTITALLYPHTSIPAGATLTVFGIQALNNSTVNFDGTNTKVNGQYGYGSQESSNLTIFSIGVHADNSTINFNGSGNQVDAELIDTNASGNSHYAAIGVRGENSSNVNFNGNNNIVKAGNTERFLNAQTNLTIYTAGIYVEGNSNLTFNASGNGIWTTNEISIGSGASLGSMYPYTVGIYAGQNSTINFNDGNNSINVTQTINFGHSQWNSGAAEVAGIYLNGNSTVNFNSQTNRINTYFEHAEGGSTAGAQAFLFGIFASGQSQINFNQANNSVQVEGDNSNLVIPTSSSGLYLDNSVLDYSGSWLNTSSKNTFEVKGYTAYGVFATGSTFKINGAPSTDYQNDLVDHSIINRSGTSGHLLDWNGTIIGWTPCIKTSARGDHYIKSKL